VGVGTKKEKQNATKGQGRRKSFGFYQETREERKRGGQHVKGIKSARKKKGKPTSKTLSNIQTNQDVKKNKSGRGENFQQQKKIPIRREKGVIPSTTSPKEVEQQILGGRTRDLPRGRQ